MQRRELGKFNKENSFMTDRNFAPTPEGFDAIARLRPGAEITIRCPIETDANLPKNQYNNRTKRWEPYTGDSLAKHYLGICGDRLVALNPLPPHDEDSGLRLVHVDFDPDEDARKWVLTARRVI